MRNAVYGEAGFPEWGTRFTEIEAPGMNIGLEIARLFMEQAVDQQSQSTAPHSSFATFANCQAWQDPSMCEPSMASMVPNRFSPATTSNHFASAIVPTRKETRGICCQIESRLNLN